MTFAELLPADQRNVEFRLHHELTHWRKTASWWVPSAKKGHAPALEMVEFCREFITVYLDVLKRGKDIGEVLEAWRSNGVARYTLNAAYEEGVRRKQRSVEEVAKDKKEHPLVTLGMVKSAREWVSDDGILHTEFTPMKPLNFIPPVAVTVAEFEEDGDES